MITDMNGAGQQPVPRKLHVLYSARMPKVPYRCDGKTLHRKLPLNVPAEKLLIQKPEPSAALPLDVLSRAEALGADRFQLEFSDGRMLYCALSQFRGPDSRALPDHGFGEQRRLPLRCMSPDPDCYMQSSLFGN